MQRYPAYKDSGFDWLGEIPCHWKAMRLKFVTRIFYGQSLTSEDRKNKEVPVYGSNGIVGYHDRTISKAPCIIIGRKGSFGKINFSDIECYPIDTTFYIDPSATKHNIRWLYYVLLSLRLDAFTKDSAVPGLNREEIYEKYVPLSPLIEQKLMVNFLDEQTAVINQFLTNKRRLIELLEEQKQVVINTAVTQGLDPNSPHKPSGIHWLGDIPAHWKIKKLKYVADVQTGLTLGQKYPNIPLIERPYLRVANVQDGYLDLAEITTIQLPDDKASRYELEIGDVLMTEGGDFDKLGRGYVWEGQIENCLHQNHIFAVRPNKEVLKPYFLTAIMSSLHGKEYFIESSKQTTNLASINSSKLKRFPVLLPTLKEQQDILNHLEQKTAEINAAIERTQREIELIEEYRTTLIAHAVTGKIDVRSGV